MPITNEQKYHGAVFRGLIDALEEFSEDCYYRFSPTNESRSGYILEITNTIRVIKLGLYVKHSSKRRTPWRFTFQYLHQVEIDVLKDECDEVFVILIAGDDGIACVKFQELKALLDENFEETEWISLSRKPNSSYRISGKDGSLDTPLQMKSFPESIKNCINLKIKN